MRPIDADTPLIRYDGHTVSVLKRDIDNAPTVVWLKQKEITSCTNCPNNPANGGSGICHCILGGNVVY